MPAVDFVVSSPVNRSVRARQVASMFDVPFPERSEVRWTGDVPIEARPWSVGLIVGPSGAGKSSIMRQMFGDMPDLKWGAASVVDDFTAPLQEVTDACSAVGFNTIPAWLRPYHVLSNGERFRVDLARRLVEIPGVIVVDEFTSVVDRQVAQIGSHAVQKHIRKAKRQFVAVTCHYDVIDWLQPDWILEPATMTFTWRSVQPRPRVEVEIRRCPYALWEMFAPFHYLTKDLNRSARCFAAYVNGRPVAFAGMLHFPHPTVNDIMRCSRLVTLPDWQGVGIAFALVDACGSAYKAIGKRLRTYPAHPALIRSFGRSDKWRMEKEGGTFTGRTGATSSTSTKGGNNTAQQQRPCATFEYVGPAMDRAQAVNFLQGEP